MLYSLLVERGTWNVELKILRYAIHVLRYAILRFFKKPWGLSLSEVYPIIGFLSIKGRSGYGQIFLYCYNYFCSLNIGQLFIEVEITELLRKLAVDSIKCLIMGQYLT